MAGFLPSAPVLVVGQPTAVDPSRAPEGKHILWVQVRVLPSTLQGDAAGQIERHALEQGQRGLCRTRVGSHRSSRSRHPRQDHRPRRLLTRRPGGGEPLSRRRRQSLRQPSTSTRISCSGRSPAIRATDADQAPLHVWRGNLAGAGTGAGSGHMLGQILGERLLNAPVSQYAPDICRLITGKSCKFT